MAIRETFILAISGGVDSVVLLHKLAAVKPPHITYIVAHFDHGIREDSSEDAEFVRKLSKKYDTNFVTKRAELGDGASENTARNARYEFLFSIMKKNKATSVITAHHQDDILETMVVNMLRGTSPRGLIGFTQPNILRPFINKTKKEIKEYADKHELKWREDRTNKDQKYMRNYVRLNIMPKLESSREELLKIREKVVENYTEIDNLSKRMLVQMTKNKKLVRSGFVIMPYIIQREIMALLLRMEGLEIDRKMVERATLAAKTLAIGKHIELNKKVTLSSEKSSIVLKA